MPVKTLFTIFLSLLAPLALKAAPNYQIPINLTLVPGPRALSEPRAIELFNQAALKLERDLPLTFSLKKISTQTARKLPICPDTSSTERCHIVQLSYWMSHTTPPKNGYSVVIAPPMYYRTRKDYALGGRASDPWCGERVGTVVVFAQETNSQGEDRFVDSTYTLAHEIGHVLGATHTALSESPVSIMHPFIFPGLRSQNMEASFALRSVNQIKRCLRR